MNDETTREAGFRIKGEWFPAITILKFQDTILLRKLCGLSTDDFVDDETPGDIKLIGTVAMAVRRAKPQWSMERVLAFVGDIDWDESFEAVNPETEVTADPPAEEDDPSARSSEESTSEADASESKTPNATGTPISLAAIQD